MGALSIVAQTGQPPELMYGDNLKYFNIFWHGREMPVAEE
jgi:hypothetical protein